MNIQIFWSNTARYNLSIPGRYFNLSPRSSVYRGTTGGWFYNRFCNKFYNRFCNKFYNRFFNTNWFVNRHCVVLTCFTFSPFLTGNWRSWGRNSFDNWVWGWDNRNFGRDTRWYNWFLTLCVNVRRLTYVATIATINLNSLLYKIGTRFLTFLCYLGGNPTWGCSHSHIFSRLELG